MSSATTYPMFSRSTEVEFVTSIFTGNTTNDLVDATATGDRANEISSAVRTGVGVFNLTFRRKWPKKVFPQDPVIVGTTVGLGGNFSAWDPVAGTATVKFSIGSVATDPATTDTIFFGFFVRNSGRNN